MIINRSKDSSSVNINFTAKDMGFLLLQSEVSYNFKDKLVEVLQSKYLQITNLQLETYQRLM
nr:hypothetical protein [Clostridioides difficile]